MFGNVAWAFWSLSKCAGSKGLLSLCVPLSQHVTLCLVSTSQITWKSFHIQSPKQALLINQPPSWCSGPPHQIRQEMAITMCCGLLCQKGTRCEPELSCLQLPVGGSTDFCLFPCSCWYCSVDVSASCRAVVTGDNLGNVVLLSTSGEEVCMAPYSTSFTGICMAHRLPCTTGAQ